MSFDYDNNLFLKKWIIWIIYLNKNNTHTHIYIYIYIFHEGNQSHEIHLKLMTLKQMSNCTKD